MVISNERLEELIAEHKPTPPRPARSLSIGRDAELEDALNSFDLLAEAQSITGENTGFGKPFNTCPVCGHHGCFVVYDGTPQTWSCFSASRAHEANAGADRIGGTAIDFYKYRENLTDKEAVKFFLHDVCGIAKDAIKVKADYQTEASVLDLELRTSRFGAPLATVANICKVLELDPALKGRFSLDTFAHRKKVALPLPWDDDSGVRFLRNEDYLEFQRYMSEKYHIDNKQRTQDALDAACIRNRHNPLIEWLDSLAWDGRERIGTLLHRYLGCDLSEYNAAVMRLVMLGAVARAFEPGCKFDTCMVLAGSQGIGKSRFAQLLAHDDAWYLSGIRDIGGGSTRSVEELLGKWIVEIPELSSFKGRSLEAIKAYITNTADTYRAAYARTSETFERTCIFIGSTNEANFLTDKTGNRRFLIVKCNLPRNTVSTALFDDGAEDDIAQAWAEAVHVYRNEKPALILPPELMDEAERMHEAYMVDEPLIGIVENYLERQLELANPSRPELTRVTVTEIQERIENDFPEHVRGMSTRQVTSTLHAIMQNDMDGWMRSDKKVRINGKGAQRCYTPTAEAILEYQRKLDLRGE